MCLNKTVVKISDFVSITVLLRHLTYLVSTKCMEFIFPFYFVQVEKCIIFKDFVKVKF